MSPSDWKSGFGDAVSSRLTDRIYNKHAAQYRPINLIKYMVSEVLQ